MTATQCVHDFAYDCYRQDALLKSYRRRLKDDVRSMADNFSEVSWCAGLLVLLSWLTVQVVKLCRVEEEGQVGRACQAEEDALEMQVRNKWVVWWDCGRGIDLTVCCARCGPPTWCGRGRVS